MTFIERVEELCKERKISKRKLERDAGLGVGSSSKWKTYTPNNATMTKIAEYFGVSIDYLSGQSEFRNTDDAVIEKWNQQYADSAVKEFGKIEAGIRIPVLGEVPCGIPIEAIEYVDAEEWEEISEVQARKGKFFGLKAKGDSMSPRIQEGDVLIVKQQEDADSGDIVIAKVNGYDACCKKLVKTTEGIMLQSFNPAYETMFFTNEEVLSKPVSIVGKVVENRQKF